MKNNNERKVLIIDDCRADLTLLKVHLQKMNLQSLLAQDAESGIEMAHAEQPDLILLDIMMPKVDGFQACRRLKADIRTASIPVIFVSSNDQCCDKPAALQVLVAWARFHN